jgi:hypothetical protein
MEINDLILYIMILFNTVFCILLPRILTLNWSKTFLRLTAEPPSISSQFFTEKLNSVNH